MKQENHILMKQIPLSTNGTKHKGKYFAIVDDEDYDYLMQWKWRVTQSNEPVRYAINHVGIMHRMIMNTPKGMTVDHINHNGLDNRKVNLRNCTIQQNSCNIRKTPNRASKFLGVYHDKKHNRWRARLVYKKKFYDGGSYATEIEAAKARNELAIKYQKEYANLNIIP